MSVKYSVSELKNPLRREEPPRYYAKAQVREVIEMDRIAREMAQGSSLSEGDIYNVLRNLPGYVTTHLADGDLVDLGNLGRFQFQLTSKGAETREEFTFRNIERARIQFRPGRLMTQVLDNLQYEEVISVKEKQEAKRKAKNGGTGEKQTP